MEGQGHKDYLRPGLWLFHCAQWGRYDVWNLLSTYIHAYTSLRKSILLIGHTTQAVPEPNTSFNCVEGGRKEEGKEGGENLYIGLCWKFYKAIPLLTTNGHTDPILFHCLLYIRHIDVPLYHLVSALEQQVKIKHIASSTKGGENDMGFESQSVSPTHPRCSQLQKGFPGHPGQDDA